FPEAHYLLGNLAARKDKYDEAEQHYRKSVNVNRAYVPAMVALASRYVTKGKLDDARTEVRQILELDPGNAEARVMRTSIDIADKNYARAETDLSSLTQEFPDNAQIHRQMGIYLLVRGRKPEAEKSFLRVLELAPTEQSFRDLTSFYIQTKQA